MTLSCIIPAFNERARIGAVLSVVAGHPEIDEVIVVDDGSTDGTAEAALAYPGVTCLRMWPNVGKTAALRAGFERSSGDLVMLIDADLGGLSAEALSALIRPVQTGRAAMSISLRGNAPAVWRWIGLDYISGERVMHRALLAQLMGRLDGVAHFGFEVFLNRAVLEAHLPLAVAPWPEVGSAAKARKYGLWRGLRADAGMLRDMVRTCGPVELLEQILGMRRLRVGPAAAPRRNRRHLPV